MVIKQGKLKLSNPKLSDFLYTYIMLECKGLNVSTVMWLKQYTRNQNKTHHIDFQISIKEEDIEKFQEMSGIELTDPIKVHLN